MFRANYSDKADQGRKPRSLSKEGRQMFKLLLGCDVNVKEQMPPSAVQKGVAGQRYGAERWAVYASMINDCFEYFEREGGTRMHLETEMCGH